MGITYGGLHGKVKNKVGGVVYRIDHGLNTVSEYQPAIHDVKTEAQLTQRRRFRSLAKFLKWYGSEFFKLTFKFSTNKLTGWANAIKKNMKAINDDGTIDKSKLNLSINNDPFEPEVIATYNRFLDSFKMFIINQDLFINKSFGIVNVLLNLYRPGQLPIPNDDEWIGVNYDSLSGFWMCEWCDETTGWFQSQQNSATQADVIMDDMDHYGIVYNPDDPNMDSYPLCKNANCIFHNNNIQQIKF